MTIRILLADDHEIVRYGLRSVLNRAGGFEVVGEAGTGREAVALAQELRPQVILMDISMPLLNGIGAAREIRRIDPGIRIIVLTMHCNRRFLVDLLEEGISGYVLKDQASEDLVRAVRTAVTGQVFLSPKIAALIAEDYLQRHTNPVQRVGMNLTPREREILQLVAEGHSTKEIATQLHVSVKTIESTRRHVMDKLEIHSVAGLTKFALAEGLTAIEF